MAKVLALLGIMLAAVHSGLALTCYSCDSSKGVTCDYGLLSFTYPTVDCAENAGSAYSSLSNLAGSISKDLLSYSCVKLVGKDKNGNSQTARTCAPYSSLTGGSICKGIAKSAQFLEGDVEELDCFTCTTDKCNSATSLGGAFTFVSVLVCSVAVLFNYY